MQQLQKKNKKALVYSFAAFRPYSYQLPGPDEYGRRRFQYESGIGI